MKPGIKYGLSLNPLNKDEKNIALNLATSWFITFCRTQRFKNTEYQLLFAKPTADISESFHLTREVLVIFSEYTSFQPRTFDFVDKIIAEFKSRLDKLCIILVSKDENIHDAIKHITMQDNASRIIIPYSYSELLHGNIKENILLRLKESFYNRDLFSYDTPLKNDNYFFGRQEIIQELYGKYQTGQCGSLFGLRRIGKTSVLYTLQRYLKKREEPVTYIDCSNTSFYFNRWYKTFYFIIKSLVENMELDVEISDYDTYTEENASILFENDLEKIYRISNEQRILLILDEIENITFNLSPKKHWNNELDFIFFWQTIRSIFQQKQYLISIIIAGVNPVAIETSMVKDHDNPIYRFISPLYLPFFNTIELKDMVTTIGKYMGVSFDDEIYTYFIDDFGGHPFIVRQVCSLLIKKSPNKRPLHITKYMYIEHRKHLQENIKDYLDLIIHILHKRYPEEYELLEFLAVEDYKTFDDWANTYPKMIEHLIGYGLIKKVHEKFYFNMESIKTYINSLTTYRKKPTTIQEKWARLNEQRNELEISLRTIVRDVLKHRYGNDTAKQHVLAIVSSKQKSMYQNLTFNEIFNSHMYFEDLRKIKEKYYNDFEHIFPLGDKAKWKLHMENINKYRADAHANEIEDDDFALVEIAIKWVNTKIKDYLG